MVRLSSRSHARHLPLGPGGGTLALDMNATLLKSQAVADASTDYLADFDAVTP